MEPFPSLPILETRLSSNNRQVLCGRVGSQYQNSPRCSALQISAKHCALFVEPDRPGFENGRNSQFRVLRIRIPRCSNPLREGHNWCTFHSESQRRKTQAKFSIESLVYASIRRRCIPRAAKTLSFSFQNDFDLHVSLAPFWSAISHPSRRRGFVSRYSLIALLTIPLLEEQHSETVSHLETQLQAAQASRKPPNSLPICGVCQVSAANACSVQCMHVYACMGCSARLQGGPCPICRAPNSIFKEILYSSNPET
jgi:hypothetical protein